MEREQIEATILNNIIEEVDTYYDQFDVENISDEDAGYIAALDEVLHYLRTLRQHVAV